jgi:hypothetical protein
MPAIEPLPTIRDLVGASADGVVGVRDANADVRRGAVYDHFGGCGAILFTREAARDRDLFRAVYLDTAEGDDLTVLVKLRFGVDRILPSFGSGTALLTRPMPGAGAGTIWTGTRILVFASVSSPAARYYAVAADVVVGAGATAVSVPVRATGTGHGSVVSLSGPGIARVDDPLWDPSWIVTAIQCSNGTSLESAPDLRARARSTQLAARKGYAQAITNACVAQGAGYVALFDSNFATGGGAQDNGLSHCYVADAGFQTTPRLVRACTAALDSYRVCGADLQVLGMRRASVDISATVTLRDDPGRLPSPDVALREALSAAFSTIRYDYDLDELSGLMAAADGNVQAVTFNKPAAPARLGRPMPYLLTRYELGTIALSYAGPS